MTTHQSTATATNAEDINLASQLAGIEDETIVSLVTRKKGTQRGGLTYGDDLVHVLIWAGWDYNNLVRLSLAYLRKFSKSGRPVATLIRDAQRKGFEVSTEDACLAIQELREAFYTRLEWNRKVSRTGSKRSTTWSDNWKYLQVDGHTYPTLKIYTGPVQPKKKKAPVPGRIYIHALKLGEVVLEKAENGHWEPNSSGKTIARRLLKQLLPVGRYVSYELDLDHTLNIGGDALKAAQLDGVSIDPAAVMSLFKIAKASLNGGR